MSANATTEIDFARYRKPELAERIGSLFDLPRGVKTYLKWGSFAVLIALVAILFTFHDHVDLPWLLVLLAYGGLVGIVLGIALATLICLNRALKTIADILGIAFEVATQVSQDTKDVRGGTKKMPSRGEVLQGVVSQVILPILEEVLVRGFFLGRVLLPVYRWTLAKAVSRICRDKSSEIETTDEDVAGHEENLEQIEASSEKAAGWFAARREKISGVACTIRRLVLTPLAILFVLAVLLATIPLLIVWNISS